MIEERLFRAETHAVVGEAVPERLIVEVQTHHIPGHLVDCKFLHIIDEVIRFENHSMELKIRQGIRRCAVGSIKIVPILEVKHPGSIVSQEHICAVEVPCGKSCITLDTYDVAQLNRVGLS